MAFSGRFMRSRVKRRLTWELGHPPFAGPSRRGTQGQPSFLPRGCLIFPGSLLVSAILGYRVSKMVNILDGWGFFLLVVVVFAPMGVGLWWSFDWRR